MFFGNIQLSDHSFNSLETTVIIIKISLYVSYVWLLIVKKCGFVQFFPSQGSSTQQFVKLCMENSCGCFGWE